MSRTGFAPLVIVAIVGALIAAGVASFVALRNLPSVQPVPVGGDQQPIITPTEPTPESSTDNSISVEHVFVDVVLSSLSAPRGKIDVFWNVVVPEEEKLKAAKPSLEFPPGYLGAVASPLHLIEEVRIYNESSDSVYLRGITNEQTDFLEMPPRSALGTKATPIMLLPGSFRFGDDGVVKCKDRDIGKSLDAEAWSGGMQSKLVGARQMDRNNTCEFEHQIEIAPRSTLTIKPDLFAYSFGLTGGAVENIFDGQHKNFIRANIEGLGGWTWLIPSKYLEHDDVSGKDTYDIGGYIVADARNSDLLSSILNIKDQYGKNVESRIRNVSDGELVRSYSIPDEPFDPQGNVFDEEVLGMQVFFSMNDFLSAQAISGTFDNQTIESLKNFQRRVGLVETGRFDEATLFATRAFDRNVSFYENYGDEQITLGLDEPGPYFRIFSVGTDDVSLGEDHSSSSLMVKMSSDCSECASSLYSLNGRKAFSFGSLRIINNTQDKVRCSLTKSGGELWHAFSLSPNEMQTQFIDIKQGTFQCEDKALQISLP
jgi:hypothetical protein